MEGDIYFPQISSQNLKEFENMDVETTLFDMDNMAYDEGSDRHC